MLGVSHLAQIKAGLASGLELAQGRRIQILTKEYIPMQIDGEPWLQRPCRINIRRLHRVNMCVPEESALKSLLRSSTEAEEDLELENDLNYVLYDNSN